MLQNVATITREHAPTSTIRAQDCMPAMCFMAHGVAIEVQGNRREVLRRVQAVLPLGAQLAPSACADSSYVFDSTADDLHTLCVDGKRLAGPASLHDILEIFEPHVTVRMAERAPQHVFVHAGVVNWRGRAILFPGYSFSGKTTLVAALVRAGALYFSDEYAILDRGGLVHPYPRALQIRKSGEQRQTPCDVRALGGFPGDGPLAVALVVFSKYRPGATWRPRGVTPGRAALQMFQYTMSAQYQPGPALDTLRRVVSSAESLKGTRGDTSQIIDFLARRFPL